jgi:hypothetical protein
MMPASLIAWVLGKTGLPQWVLELIALAAVAGAVYAYHVHTFNSGVAAEVARVNLQNAKVTAQLEGKAATAGALHADEDKDLGEFRTAHPVEPVRLCVAAPSLQTPASVQISVATPAIGSDVQSVPAGNSGVRAEAGPDISGLLEALAARADQIAAQARELQTRDLP